MLQIISVTKKRPGGLFYFARESVLNDWSRKRVPSSLRDELGEVAALVATAQSVTNLDFAVLSGALIFGLGNIAVWDVD
jgi:hypothetical protein